MKCLTNRFFIFKVSILFLFFIEGVSQAAGALRQNAQCVGPSGKAIAVTGKTLADWKSSCKSSGGTWAVVNTTAPAKSSK